ncbi:MAG TPA: hypothetical protein VNS32_28580 [Flavisolibacter sp.]|nr:hypothetical protein [Flavisolibacter sp.]
MKFTIKTFRKQILAFWLITVFSIPVLAQDQAIEKLATAMTDSLAYLQLTDQQISDARGLNNAAATSLIQLAQKAKKDTSLKGRELAHQVIDVMKQRNEGIESMLTQNQKKLYNDHHSEQIAELQTKVMTTQLDLTDQQIPQVYHINLKYAGEQTEDIADEKESDHKSPKVRTDKSIKLDIKEKDKQLKKILTQGQFEKYEKNKEAMEAAVKEKKG